MSTPHKVRDTLVVIEKEVTLSNEISQSYVSRMREVRKEAGRHKIELQANIWE